MNPTEALILIAVLVVGGVVGVLTLLGMAAAAAWVLTASLSVGTMALLIGLALAALCYKIRVALLYPVIGVLMGSLTLVLMFSGHLLMALLGVLLGIPFCLFFSPRHRQTLLHLAEDPSQHQTYVDAAGAQHTFVVADDRLNPAPFNRAPVVVAINLLGVLIGLALMLFLFWNNGGVVGKLAHIGWGALMVGMAWGMLTAAYAASQHQRPGWFLLAIGGFVASLVALLLLRERDIHLTSFATMGWSAVLGFLTVLTLATGAVAFDVERKTGVEIFSQSLSPAAVGEAKEWMNRYCPSSVTSLFTVARELWMTMKELCTVTVRR
ncbi:MAG: hypothetical protein NZT92_01070 [Abditibacteriales bacterium]|nr:hypothetical protein [Abditibacteriales bacterium]MDW8364410.1 hypothetical protein [Abditibacteriales bacterium]